MDGDPPSVAHKFLFCIYVLIPTSHTAIQTLRTDLCKCTIMIFHSFSIVLLWLAPQPAADMGAGFLAHVGAAIYMDGSCALDYPFYKEGMRFEVSMPVKQFQGWILDCELDFGWTQTWPRYSSWPEQGNHRAEQVPFVDTWHVDGLNAPGCGI